MDIAGLSMALNQVDLSRKVDVAVLKMAMDTSKDYMNDLTKMMEVSVNPDLGSNIDIRV